LFIGLLVTAIIQSSSAATSMVVALVAAGSVSLESAVPMIMGANIGTTITSTFVSIGFITMGKEYKRAVAASTIHDFFNILTVAILFPLEYYFNLLSELSKKFSDWLFDPATPNDHTSITSFGNPLSEFLVNTISNELILVALSFLLLLVSVLIFRSIIANWLGVKNSKTKLIFKNPVSTFLWGLVSTALIRSSTITTSLVVPLVAKKVIRLQSAFLFILGANIGTTITAFIAAFSNSHAAIGIAITHLLFNCIGVLIFILPGISKIPILLATGMSRLSYKYRLVIVAYLLIIFFIIPFSLILVYK
jgi:sodium-dependent phosphate cotransporter